MANAMKSRFIQSLHRFVVAASTTRAIVEQTQSQLFMDSQQQMTVGSPPNSAQASLEPKGLNAIVSGVVGVAGAALLVLLLDPVWPVTIGVVAVCLASAIVFCFL